MRLTVVGCSGSYPGPDSPASCYLLEAEHDRRAAPGGCCSTSAAARSARCTATSTRSSIDAVLLSHLHADHCLDLCGYYVLRKYHPTGPQPPDPGLGAERTPRGRMARAYDLPEDPGMSEEFDFRTCAGAVEIGPFTVSAVPVVHPVEAFGLRVSAGGATLAYTGDTGPCDALDRARRAAPTCCWPRRRSGSGDDNPPGST